MYLLSFLVGGGPQSICFAWHVIMSEGRKRLWVWVSVSWSPAIQASISELCSSQDHRVYFILFFAREWKGVPGVEGMQQSRLSLFLDKPTILMNDIKYESGTRCSSVLLGIFCWLLSKIQCGKTHAPYKLFSSADIIESISMSYCFPPLFYAAVSVTFNIVFHIYVFTFYVSSHPRIFRGPEKSIWKCGQWAMGCLLKLSNRRINWKRGLLRRIEGGYVDIGVRQVWVQILALPLIFHMSFVVVQTPSCVPLFATS